MPNRILRARLRQSERFNRCSESAQNLYVRLITLVDDFGRYEAHPTLIASEAYPYGDLTGTPVESNEICKRLENLHHNDLLKIYEVEGKKFLQLERWRERVRADVSQFPPPSANGVSSDGHAPDKCLLKRQRQRQSANAQSQRPKPTSTPKEIKSDEKNSFEALRIANLIISNHGSWHYDNCKVDITKLKSSSLQTVMAPFTAKLSQKKILAAWSLAVFKAHGAKVDKLANDPTRYAVRCFQNLLKEEINPTNQ